MALPCLGRLCLGALKEAPTGALTHDSARDYDPDGSGRAMLWQLDEEMARQLRPFDQNVASAERNLAFYQRLENQDMVSQRREAENYLREAQSESYRAYERIVPMFTELKDEVRSALRRGLFAIPRDQRAEQMQIEERNLQRLVADSEQLTREVHARMRANEGTPSSEPERPDPIPYEASSDPADFEMDLAEAREKIDDIIQAVVRTAFRYTGYARSQDGTLLAYGNRPLNELPHIELQYLWEQLRVWQTINRIGEPLPNADASRRDTFVRVLQRARLLPMYPPEMLGDLDDLEELNTDDRYRRLQELYLQLRSWEVTPPEFRTLDLGYKQRMLNLMSEGMERGFRPPGYSEGLGYSDVPYQLYGRPLDNLPDNELLLLFVQFRLFDSRFGEEGHRLSVPDLTESRRANMIQEIAAIGVRGDGRTMPRHDVLRNYDDYWLQVFHAELMSRQAVPPDVMQAFRDGAQAGMPAYAPTSPPASRSPSPLRSPRPFPAVDVEAATHHLMDTDDSPPR